MSDHCNNHARYKVGCRPCYDARVTVAQAHSLQRLCSAVCPACKTKSEWRYREDFDAETGSTTYAHICCPKCGVRSREVVNYQEHREEIEQAWKPVTGEPMANLLFAIEAALPFVRSHVGTRMCSSSGGPVALENILKEYDWDKKRWDWVNPPNN